MPGSNSTIPTVVRHIANLAAAEKDKSFDYGGRTTEPEGKFANGECGMIQTSSGAYGIFKCGAKFDFGVAELPYYPDVPGAPQNSIIGGASLWVMAGKTPQEYKGVAKFFTFLSHTDLQQELHEVTGYLPITKAAYEATKASGFYEKNPGREIPVLQLTRKPPTENSRGLRLGNLVQIRDIIAEDLEAIFAGKEDAQAGLDDAVKRGNALLAQFRAEYRITDIATTARDERARLVERRVIFTGRLFPVLLLLPQLAVTVDLFLLAGSAGAAAVGAAPGRVWLDNPFCRAGPISPRSLPIRPISPRSRSALSSA